MDQLPAPVPPNEDAGPAALLIYRSIWVLSFGGGAIGHDGGIPVGADFDLIRDQRVEIHAAGSATFQVLRPVLDGPARAVMGEVLVQDALQESAIRLDVRPIEVLDGACTLPDGSQLESRHRSILSAVLDQRTVGRDPAPVAQAIPI